MSEQPPEDLLRKLADSMPKREPSAALRNSAAGLYELLTAYVGAGFTRAEALQVVMATMVAAMQQAGNGR